MEMINNASLESIQWWLIILILLNIQIYYQYTRT
jgi:hypothetical protein